MIDDAGALLMTMRVVNGKIILDLPDDPAVFEGPTHFSRHIHEIEARAIFDALGKLETANVPSPLARVQSIIQEHVEQLQRIEMKMLSDTKAARAQVNQANSLLGELLKVSRDS